MKIGTWYIHIGLNEPVYVKQKSNDDSFVVIQAITRRDRTHFIYPRDFHHFREATPREVHAYNSNIL